MAHASDNIDGLLQRVDAALYAAKRGGGNRAAGIVDPNQPDTVEPARCEKAPVVQHVIAVRKRRARLAG